MEDSGRVDDEGRPILERVDLMEAFFAGVSDLKIMYIEGFGLRRRGRVRMYLSSFVFIFGPRSRP